MRSPKISALFPGFGPCVDPATPTPEQTHELLLGKALLAVAGTRLADSFFLVKRYRPLADATELADR